MNNIKQNIDKDTPHQLLDERIGRYQTLNYPREGITGTFKRSTVFMKTNFLNVLAKKLTLVTLMLTLMVSTAQAGHGMWVWGETQEALNDTVKARELVDFCLENNITEVYLFTPNSIIGNYPAWEALIERFHLNGIKVEALLGTADWLMPAGGWDPAR